MNILKLHFHSKFSSISGNSSTHSSFLAPHFLLLPTHKPKMLSLTLNYSFEKQKNVRASTVKTQIWSDKEEENSEGYEYLAPDGVVYKKTLRLVEGAMFAAVSGLAYLLSNSLAIENYFGCFFALPIVVSSMRWGIAAGRKTMVATVVLLFVLSGPVKALNYMLMHGLLGFTMGSLWRLRTSWGASIFLCALARAVGALGYVILSSFLIGENILALVRCTFNDLLFQLFSYSLQMNDRSYVDSVLVDYDKYSCFSLIHSHILRQSNSSIDEFYIHLIRDSAFDKLCVLRVLAASSLCHFSYQIRHES